METIYLHLKAERKWVFESVPKTWRNEHRPSIRTGERPRLVTRKVCRERRGRLPNRGSCEWRQETAFAAGDVTRFYRNEVAVSRERGHSRVTQTLIRHPILELDLIEPVCAVSFQSRKRYVMECDRKEQRK